MLEGILAWCHTFILGEGTVEIAERAKAGGIGGGRYRGTVFQQLAGFVDSEGTKQTRKGYIQSVVEKMRNMELAQMQIGFQSFKGDGLTEMLSAIGKYTPLGGYVFGGRNKLQIREYGPKEDGKMPCRCWRARAP